MNASTLSGVHGLPTEGEDIKVQVIRRQTLWQMLEQGKLTNAATIIATQWLQLHSLGLRLSGAVDEFTPCTDYRLPLTS